ncbi:MAG: hypothetical protein ACFE9D_02040 [Promethearchaeota archaeon]
MRFKWLADDCTTWDDIIHALHHRITAIEDLKAQGAILAQNNNDDYIFYEIPGETAIFATLTTLTDTECTFQLDDGATITTPRPDWTDFTHDHLHCRLVLLITETGELNGVSLPHHVPSDP